mmetsp:Transcript_2407/g.4408  ORF Transcript_2407/g.4408 Transcript_2407/m.4408 type:complete len:202 (+) Transcript_2407:1844-2449(+)
MFLSVCLHRGCNASIRVALAKHGVHCASQDLCIASTDLKFLISLCIFWVVRHCKAFALQLLDGSKELRHGCRNVWKLDDVGCGVLGQSSECSQIVLDALRRLQIVRELRQDTCSHGDVLLHDLHTGKAAEGAKDWQEGIGRQHGRLIRVGVDDFDIVDFELDGPAILICLLQDSKFCASWHVVQPFSQLDRAILVHVQLGK